MSNYIRANYNKPIRPLEQLLFEIQDIELQIFKYCKTEVFMPQKQDFENIIDIFKVSKEIESLTITLNEYWVEKNWKNFQDK